MPSLTYNGSSGFSGTDTSKERAMTQDEDGTTNKVQQKVLIAVDAGNTRGVTIKELRRLYPEHHHGSLSGALTNLHRDDVIARLEDQRDKCKIYVMPWYVGERVTEKPGHNKGLARILDSLDALAEVHKAKMVVNRRNGTSGWACTECNQKHPCRTTMMIQEIRKAI